jgi:hypothetical protein
MVVTLQIYRTTKIGIFPQMAMAPDSMMNHHVSGVSVGVAMVIHHAAAAPTRHAAQDGRRRFYLC